MSWDRFQREMLEALGYRVYMPVGLRAQPTAHGQMTPSMLPSSELLLALARAAALDAAALSVEIDLQVAYRDPMSKRALWPQLRRLRGRGKTP